MTEGSSSAPAGLALPGFPAGYVPLRELGAGAWGTVVLARQVSVDRLVAVKAVIGGARAGADAVARFRREARTLAALAHPAVVRVYELVTHEDDLYLVMEHVEGRSLRELLDAGGLEAGTRVQVLSDVAAALTAAAEKGVVHRDVKPANVLVRDDGRATLVDFGLARMLGDVAAFRTAVGTPTGSPAYMAPEQADGSDGAGPEADAFSFGVLAFEVLVGALPNDGTEVAEVLRRHRDGTPHRPSALLPRFPAAAERVLLAALAARPDRRPLPAEVAAVLRAVPVTRWPAPLRTPRPAVSHAEPDVTQGPRAPLPAPAPAAVRARPPAAPTEEPGRVEPPVYDPGSPRRALRRHAPAAAAVGVVLAGAVLLAVRDGGGGFAVTSLQVGVTPAFGRCPAASFDVTAVVGTNGRAGRLSLVWTRPDGTTTPVRSVRVPGGRRVVSARLRYAVSGSRPFTGEATVELPQQDRRATAPIRYVCP